MVRRASGRTAEEDWRSRLKQIRTKSYSCPPVAITHLPHQPRLSPPSGIFLSPLRSCVICDFPVPHFISLSWAVAGGRFWVVFVVKLWHCRFRRRSTPCAGSACPSTVRWLPAGPTCNPTPQPRSRSRPRPCAPCSRCAGFKLTPWDRKHHCALGWFAVTAVGHILRLFALVVRCPCADLTTTTDADTVFLVPRPAGRRLTLLSGSPVLRFAPPPTTPSASSPAPASGRGRRHASRFWPTPCPPAPKLSAPSFSSRRSEFGPCCAAAGSLLASSSARLRGRWQPRSI